MNPTDRSTDSHPAPTRHQLLQLISKWGQRASASFRSAAMEPEEFPRRFIEHGAMNYFNCAMELQTLLDSNIGKEAPEKPGAHDALGFSASSPVIGESSPRPEQGSRANFSAEAAAVINEATVQGNRRVLAMMDSSKNAIPPRDVLEAQLGREAMDRILGRRDDIPTPRPECAEPARKLPPIRLAATFERPGWIHLQRSIDCAERMSARIDMMDAEEARGVIKEILLGQCVQKPHGGVAANTLTPDGQGPVANPADREGTAGIGLRQGGAQAGCQNHGGVDAIDSPQRQDTFGSGGEGVCVALDVSACQVKVGTIRADGESHRAPLDISIAFDLEIKRAISGQDDSHTTPSK